MIMTSYVKLVNIKVVDNLVIYLLLKFHNHKPYGLRIIAVTILLSEILVLWTDLKDGIFDLDNYRITLR